MDDIVERLRDSRGAIVIQSSTLVEAADEILALRRQVGEQSEQIERLRAEVEATKAALDDAWTERDFALGEADRLQALIDAYDEAERCGTVHQYHDAQDALLAAATPKEDET